MKQIESNDSARFTPKRLIKTIQLVGLDKTRLVQTGFKIAVRTPGINVYRQTDKQTDR